MGFKSGPGTSGDVTFGDAVTDVVKAGGAISGSANLALGGNIHASGSLSVGGAANTGNATFSSATASKPNITIKNTTNDTNGAFLTFLKDKGSAAADNDNIGTITWYGDNDAQEQTQFANMACFIGDASNGTERGKLRMSVAEYDGTLTTGFEIRGDSDDGVIDWTLGAGANSFGNVTGDLSLNHDAAVMYFGTDSEVSLTHIHNTGLQLEPGLKITKGTTNNTLNFGTDNSNDGAYDSITGAMGPARAGTVIGQINTTNLAQGANAYGNVDAEEVKSTDVIIITPVGGFRIVAQYVRNGAFSFAAMNDTGSTITAHASNSSAQIIFNWVAL